MQDIWGTIWQSQVTHWQEYGLSPPSVLASWLLACCLLSVFSSTCLLHQHSAMKLCSPRTLCSLQESLSVLYLAELQVKASPLPTKVPVSWWLPGDLICNYFYTLWHLPLVLHVQAQYLWLSAPLARLLFHFIDYWVEHEGRRWVQLLCSFTILEVFLCKFLLGDWRVRVQFPGDSFWIWRFMWYWEINSGPHAYKAYAVSSPLSYFPGIEFSCNVFSNWELCPGISNETGPVGLGTGVTRATPSSAQGFLQTFNLFYLLSHHNSVWKCFVLHITIT